VDEPKMTRIDHRIRSGGYILPALGYGAWLIGVIAPLIAWLANTQIYDRNTGSASSAASTPTVIFGIVAAVLGTLLIRLGAKIRRLYRAGKRSGV
jgi:hypothetical protein